MLAIRNRKLPTIVGSPAGIMQHAAHPHAAALGQPEYGWQLFLSSQDRGLRTPHPSPSSSPSPQECCSWTAVLGCLLGTEALLLVVTGETSRGSVLALKRRGYLWEGICLPFPQIAWLLICVAFWTHPWLKACAQHCQCLNFQSLAKSYQVPKLATQAELCV